MARKRREFASSEFTPVFRHFTNLLINRVRAKNLPEEIDEKFLLYHVLLYGRVLLFEKNSKYHAMWFSGRGKLNEYYIQKEFLVVNPWAEETSDTYDENNAGILYSDINAYIENADVGLYDFIKEYADIINSIDKSIKALAKNTKVIAFITGATNSIVSSARQMVKNLVDGDDCFGVCEESLVDSIKVNPISDRMDYKFSELIKTRQYFISDFYQKIGISANMNMKAERLTDNESQLIDSVSEVDFNHILDNLNYSVKFINDKFGLNISFELNEDKDVNNLTEEESEEDGTTDTGNGTSDNGNDTEGNQITDSKPSVSGEQGTQSAEPEQLSTGTEDTDMAEQVAGESGSSEENNQEENDSDNGVTVNVVVNSEDVNISEEESDEDANMG